MQSFFGRTYNNLSSISECKNNGECVINKKNRTACKACRLRKCLLVGMSKSGSRYGRRSNWFKIHCLLQEQQQQAANSLAASSIRPPPFLPLFRTQTLSSDTKSSASDSGASSGDPEEDTRSPSAFSRKPPSSPLSERDFITSKKLPSPLSDNDFMNKFSSSNEFLNKFPNSNEFLNKLPNGNEFLNKFPNSNELLNKFSNGNEFLNKFPNGNEFLTKFPNSFVQLPAVAPAPLSLLPPNGIIPNWLPPFQGLGNPSAWRDLWLKPQITPASPAPDQDEPIDLSVKPKVQSEDKLDNSPKQTSIEESVKQVPLDLTLER